MTQPVTNEDLRALAGYFRLAFWFRLLAPTLALGTVAAAYSMEGRLGDNLSVTLMAMAWLSVTAMLVADVCVLHRQRANPALALAAQVTGARRILGTGTGLIVWFVLGAVCLTLPPIGIPIAIGILGRHALYGLKLAAGAAALGGDRAAELRRLRRARNLLLYACGYMTVMGLPIGFAVAEAMAHVGRPWRVIVFLTTVGAILALPAYAATLRAFPRAVRAMDTLTAEDLNTVGG